MRVTILLLSLTACLLLNRDNKNYMTKNNVCNIMLTNETNLHKSNQIGNITSTHGAGNQLFARQPCAL